MSKKYDKINDDAIAEAIKWLREFRRLCVDIDNRDNADIAWTNFVSTCDNIVENVQYSRIYPLVISMPEESLTVERLHQIIEIGEYNVTEVRE